MSWMLVSGKVYFCTKCQGHIQVEYEGGALETQVGDSVIDEQSVLLDEFAQPNVNPETDGYYLYEKIICEDCFVKLGIDETDAKRLMVLLDEVDATINHVVAQVCAVFQNPTPHDLKEFIGESAFKELSGQTMLPARKKRKINEAFQDWHCSDNFLSRRIEAELEKLPKPLPQANLKKFAMKLRKQYLTVFVKKNICEAENINPFIQSEHTVRVPLPNTPMVTVIIEGEIELNAFKHNNYFKESVLEILQTELPNLVSSLKQIALSHFVGATP
jgi:hypothetical protein